MLYLLECIKLEVKNCKKYCKKYRSTAAVKRENQV